ncbi:MAG: hypothetical protein ACOC8N_04545 [Spirochaetota bacterium]
MPFFFEIDERYRFSVEVLVDTGSLEQDMAGLFKKTIAVATRIGREYESMTAGEGKILGQERTHLIESLDTLFTHLVILFHRLKRNLPEERQVTEIIDFKVPLRVRYNKFVARGELSRDDLYSVRQFGRDYGERILSKIKDMLMQYKDGLNDREHRVEKFQKLYRLLDGILYNTLIMRYNIQNLLLDQ